MDSKLYYCRHWKHIKLNLNNKEFCICISPKIDGNEAGTIIQFHGVIVQNENIARIGTINNNISKNQASILLNDLEDNLRNVIRSNVTWLTGNYDKFTVKIWYYERQESNYDAYNDDKRKFLPLRFAMTAININSLDNIRSNMIKDSLEKVVIKWLKKILNYR